MFATPAFAQTAGAASSGGIMDLLQGPLPMLLMIFVLGYFMLLRPQQQRAKKHQELIKAIKRGDRVVLSSGVKGKVSRVDETEVQVEIATNVVVTVVRTSIADIQAKSEPVPANDAKS